MVLCVLLPLPGIPTTTYLRIVRTMTHLVPHCQPPVVMFVSRATEHDRAVVLTGRRACGRDHAGYRAE
jgi:hypothetical protein